MFYKVENGVLIKAPQKSLKIFIANPTDEQYKFFGYTDKLIEDERPQEIGGKFIAEYYEQNDDVVYKHYSYIDAPDETE